MEIVAGRCPRVLCFASTGRGLTPVNKLKPAGGGSRITLTYSVGGFADRPLADWAPLVDEMLGGQLKRLTRYITQGNPEAPKAESTH